MALSGHASVIREDVLVKEVGRCCVVTSGRRRKTESNKRSFNSVKLKMRQAWSKQGIPEGIRETKESRNIRREVTARHR